MTENKLTVVITTSPIPSNPHTDMIIATLKSLDLVGLKYYKKLVYCDGYIISNKNTYKSGRITKEKALDYEDFIENLKKYAKDEKSSNIEIIDYETDINSNPVRNGFAINIKRSLLRIKTPYIMVVQHDHQFIRKVDINSIINGMELSKPLINYIGFMSKSVQKLYQNLSRMGKFWSDLQPLIAPKSTITEEKILNYYYKKYGLNLMPLNFWYDRIHIVRTEYYKNYVFNEKESGVKVKNFIEDSFGQKEMNDLKKYGLDAFKKYNSFILYDSKESAVVHVSGRTYGKYKKQQFNDPTKTRSLTPPTKPKRDIVDLLGLDVFRTMLMKADINEVIKTCQNSEAIQKICTEMFWKDYLKTNYSMTYKPSNYT